MNNLKAFTLVVGQEWHDLPRENKMQGALIVGYKNNPPNPTWDNPHLIRKAIEAVPCGECEGKGEVTIHIPYPALNVCPTCNGTGVINEWERFWSYLLSKYRTKMRWFVEALTTPSLLIQAYLNWKESNDAR